MALHESGEDYLEAILVIRNRNGNCRSIDIAHELSFSKPSVSVAMKNLKANNYITVDGMDLLISRKPALKLRIRSMKGIHF